MDSLNVNMLETNSLNAICLLALYQQEGATPIAHFRVYMVSWIKNTPLSTACVLSILFFLRIKPYQVSSNMLQLYHKQLSLVAVRGTV